MARPKRPGRSRTVRTWSTNVRRFRQLINADEVFGTHSLDHMIVFGEAHLRRILGAYAAYHNESRTHRSLNKDAPFHRAIERLGPITSHPILGGLHHQYCRIQFSVHTGASWVH